MYDRHIANTRTDTQIGLKLLQQIFNTAKNAKICDMCTLLKYAENATKCQIRGNCIFAFF